MPGHEQDARAFGYQVARTSSDGYEVSFQPIDPISGQALPLRDKTLFFSRSRRNVFPLAEGVTVSGFFGDPRLRSPLVIVTFSPNQMMPLTATRLEN
jgi:hypothetical protein